ncbi:MAG: DUF4468 domain-containing protein [Dysgonomonas sp.]|nr:DUF4468 domain-containing protein [Dysgonomonas sp.]
MMKFLKFVFFVLFCTISVSSIKAQGLLQNNDFRYVPVYKGQAVLVKEIPLRNTSEAAQNYNRIKSWVKKNYTTNIFTSSILYHNDDQRASIKSRVELLLPILNAQNISEKSVMSYSLNIFISNGRCIFEVTDITYKIQNAIPHLKNKVKAEDFVTEQALSIQDQYIKEKIETQKGTLYYFNNLAESLAKSLNP